MRTPSGRRRKSETVPSSGGHVLLGHMLPWGPRLRFHCLPHDHGAETTAPPAACERNCGWRAPGHPPRGGGSQDGGRAQTTQLPGQPPDGRAGETQGRAARSHCFGREGPQRRPRRGVRTDLPQPHQSPSCALSKPHYKMSRRNNQSPQRLLKTQARHFCW